MRSSGIVVLYLQKARDAKRSYGSILHIDSKFNGTTRGGFSDVETEKMSQFLENFYETCSVKPKEISYVEASGIGIKVDQN